MRRARGVGDTDRRMTSAATSTVAPVKRGLVAAVVFVLLVAVGGSTTATAAKPLGRVEASFTAERIGFLCPTCGLGRLGSVTILVEAIDRTPGPPACPTCAGPDTGVVIHQYGPGTGREGDSEIQPVTDVQVDGTRATVFTATSIFTFRDGGAPGTTIAGPADPFGLLPTLDSYEQGFWVGHQRFSGFLTAGEITVTPPSWSFPSG
jgi:hypothetical protein